MNKRIPISLSENRKYLSDIIEKGFIPTERNFLPFSYRMNEAVFGALVGVQPMYIFIQEDTSRMLVREILELEEKILEENNKETIVVTNQQDKDKYIEVSQAMYQLLGDMQFESDKERIAYLQRVYPEVCL